MSSYRDFLSTTRGVPRAAAALLAQRGTSRVNGLLSEAGLAIATVTTKIRTTLTAFYAIAGVVHTKAAADNIAFTAAHTVTKQTHGAVLVQVDAAGTVTTKVSATPQAFGSAADARAALPAADANTAAIGYVAILADRLSNGLTAIATLAISATATKFKTTTIAAYVIAGVRYTKAITDLLVFSAAHTVTATKFGIILVQIDATGAITTKVSGATQAFADAPTALAALPAVDAGNVSLGSITIHAGVADWVGNTTALTGVSGFVDTAISAEHDFVCATDDLALVTHAISDEVAL